MSCDDLLSVVRRVPALLDVPGSGRGPVPPFLGGPDCPAAQRENQRNRAFSSSLA